MSAVLEQARRPESPRAMAGSGILAGAGQLSVSLATDPDEIRQALRLRHRVFAGELGARIGDAEGLDRDIFDPYCRHLVVRDNALERVVGTYRVLMPEQAKALGCLYSDGEFWLTRLNPLRDSIVELGRSCVDPEYRSGAAIMLLWAGLGALLAGSGHRYLMGCVSVPLNDGGGFAANLYRKLAAENLADETLRVWPRERLDVDAHPVNPDLVIPALMKGYLRAGAQLLGEPHLDREFGCADFPMMLSLDAIGSRHRRRFLQ